MVFTPEQAPATENLQSLFRFRGKPRGMQPFFAVARSPACRRAGKREIILVSLTLLGNNSQLFSRLRLRLISILIVNVYQKTKLGWPAPINSKEKTAPSKQNCFFKFSFFISWQHTITIVFQDSLSILSSKNY